MRFIRVTQEKSRPSLHMQLVQWMLATNVVWDFISTYILLDDGGVWWRQRVARMHTDWWSSEKDNTPQSRRVLALFLFTLGVMRALPLADTRLLPIAIASYCWEIFWLLAGAWCGVMSVERVWPSATLCTLCVFVCLM